MRQILAAVAILAAGCWGPYPTPGPPDHLQLKGAVNSTTNSASVSGREAKALLVQTLFDQEPGEEAPRRVGMATEDGAVALLRWVAALLEDGTLFYNDLPHQPAAPPAYLAGKLSMSELKVRGSCGTIDSNYRFTPAPDVLCALDSGYRYELALGRARRQVVVQPEYHAALHAPFWRQGFDQVASSMGFEGESNMRTLELQGLAGEAGDWGRRGTNGGRGRDAELIGQDGGDGGPGGPGGAGEDGKQGTDSNNPGEMGGSGQPGLQGGDGGDGGDGGHGNPGGDAGRGQDGRRGIDGPTMEVLVRPVFSKFYPDDDLVYVEVKASWPDEAGITVRTEYKNYIFHLGEVFEFRSIGGHGGRGGDGGTGGSGGAGGNGGSGGPGGAGGRGGDGGKGGPASGGQSGGRQGDGADGGDGGNGGNGGHGGDGARGGNGGDGGDGGRAGDGGAIRITFMGPPGFVAVARRTLRFLSQGGEGGEAGQGGQNGRSGAAGQPGARGQAGQGGDGGQGYYSGRRGERGSFGNSGSSGSEGPWNGYQAAPGRRGPPGRSGPVQEVIIP